MTKVVLLALYDPSDRFMGRVGNMPRIADPAESAAISRDAAALAASWGAVVIGQNTKRILDGLGVEPPGFAVAWPRETAPKPSPGQLIDFIRARTGGDIGILGGLQTFRAFASLCNQVVLYRVKLDASAGHGKPLFFPSDIA